VELGELARDTTARAHRIADHFIQCGREALGRLEEDDRPGVSCIHWALERFAFARLSRHEALHREALGRIDHLS